ncbi:MAG: response regulator [Deltaproteobacteria bacterium]|nr:response regulator [Deltaproteobacteria bacterium]
MNKKYTFFIIDDDPLFTKRLTGILKEGGQTVHSGTAGAGTVPEIMAHESDCIILSVTALEGDSLELLRHLRGIDDLAETKIVVAFEQLSDQARQDALAAGADDVITKPVNEKTVLRDLKEIIKDHISFTFWGIHGTLTVPGRKTARYGGNTPCVTLCLPGDTLFIFDAGSGIKELSNHLLSEGRTITEAIIFITHPHWDHIHGLPFFVPLYPKGNSFDIYGPPNGSMSLRELIAGQMDGVYFPINIKEFGAEISFFDLGEEQFNIGAATIQTMLLNHPGQCLGYRLDYKGRSFCYVTDNELYPRSNALYDESYVRKLEGFIADTDVLITDCTYMDEEYEGKIGWGHSSVNRAVEMSDRAGVKKLYLFHHDLDQTDDDIDNKLEVARTILEERGSSTICIAPKEGETFGI